ncbi:MAG: PD-(D/E)XK nuclease family protein, partial [bacterium]|nr:PD-(D/E)XK nuclease family protein [bacterium]
MVIYSHSKLSTFEQCNLKYKFRYIDKIIPELEQSIETLLGSCVHETLEWLYKTILISNRQKIPSLDETIIYYSETWQKEFVPEIVIVRKDLNANH